MIRPVFRRNEAPMMPSLDELRGESPGIIAVREKVERFQAAGRRLPPVLIQGETGTGKGLLARVIHGAGPRRDGPFVDVNCAAIPETLIEAEMFGFERGAFTDARHSKQGLFQAAHGGTIFLDEIGLLSPALQAKVLKAIDERAVRRLGNTRSESVDVWILTATNEDLALAVREKRFRADLYHRLAVVTLSLPPLRERREDIWQLAEHFLARACADYGFPPKALAPDARAALLAYAWPGNVRELSNVIERAALMSEATPVTADGLGLAHADASMLGAARDTGPRFRLEDAMGDIEREHLREALRETNWNVSRAAARLGISRNTLRYRIDKYRLSEEALASAASRRARPTTSAGGVPSWSTPDTPAPTGLRWESRRITLMRATVGAAGSRAFPSDATRIMELILQKVESFGGRVDELGPAGVIALFGVEPAEDAPRRAANAALAALKAGERIGRRDAGGAVMVKIAIDIGEMPVGRTNGTAEIDQAAKRQAMTVLDALISQLGSHGIVVSAAVSPFLQRRFDLVPIGPSPARVYRLEGLEEPGLGLRGRMVKFVGRHHELGLLGSRFESAVQGHGQIVGVGGEAGIGKSRLLFEFRQSLAGRAVSTLEGHCLSYGTAIPYLPVLDLVRTLCHVTDADTPELIGEKIRVALEGPAMEVTEAVPYLLHLLGHKSGTDRVATLSPDVVKMRTFEILHALFLNSSQHTPLMIAVEDLHWIDRTSEEYLASLADRVAGVPILLVATYRAGYRPPWIEKSYATQIALQPLAAQDSLTVVRAVFGTDHIADSLAEVILAKAEGNPFFLEEVARAAREQAHTASLAVPDTIQQVLLARIDRLPFDERRLLQSAAVVGKNFSVEILRAIANLSNDVVRRGLKHLQTGEFLHETGRTPEPEYTFKHSLTQEVAYESLPPEERQALHAKIVEAAETLFAGRRTEYVEQLAHHAVRGGLWDKAVIYLRQSGIKAASRSANREAVANFEHALEALRHLPATRARLEQAIDLRFDIRHALWVLGDVTRALDVVIEAKGFAESLSDQSRLGRACSWMSGCYFWLGEHARAATWGERALEIAIESRDLTLQGITNGHLSQIYHAMGEYRQAIEVTRRNVELLEGTLSRERPAVARFYSIISRCFWLLSLGERGEFAEGLALGDQLDAMTRQTDVPFSRASADGARGWFHLIKGEFAETVSAMERCLTLCEATGLHALTPWISSVLGSAYTRLGRGAEALPLLERAETEAASLKVLAGQSIRVVFLGEAHLLDGRPREATECAFRALELAREHRERGFEAYAFRLFGEIASHPDQLDFEAAEKHYGHALALATDHDMRPLIAHCHFGLGKLYRRRDRPAQASEHLNAAISMFRSMDMQFWLRQAEALA